MEASKKVIKSIPQAVLVPAGEDRLGPHKTLGISDVAFKITSNESQDLFAVELTLVQKGGPARHVHHTQDEWFYFIEGEFIIEVGDERINAKPGDSVFGPRNVPHVWAFAGGVRGKMLASVMPAGKLEQFFINADMYKSLPGSDQNLWRPFDLEWIGPPLKVE